MMKYWKIKALVWCIVVLSGLIGCSRQTEQTQTAQAKPSFIRPPLPKLSIAYQNFDLDAEQGAKFTYSSGTEIEIPANALLTAEGLPVKGKVKLQYREFHDALDVFLSGIPMKYDSAGKAQNFQTAGMFDIRASQNEQNLSLAPKQKIKVKMASWQAGNDYNFYALDTIQQTWSYQSSSQAQVNLAKTPLKQAIAQMTPSPTSDWLILNYGQALDVAFQDDWRIVEKNLATFKTKLQTYGVEYWNDVRALDEVIFQGNKYPAYMLVWKKLENPPIPAWVRKGEYIRDIYDRYDPNTKDYIRSDWVKVQSLGNGIYQLAIKHKNQYFNLKISPMMRIASLLQNSPDYWKNQYEQAMAKVRLEEEKISQIAEVFRPIEVKQFGIYNYDRLLNEPEAVVVKADFEVGKNQSKPNLVYYISSKTRGVVPYKPHQWATVALTPDTTARIFAVMPDYTIAYYRAEEYAKIDFQKLKAEYAQKRQPSWTFQLNVYPNLLQSKAELQKALGM
jgi:hypothetical protein